MLLLGSILFCFSRNESPPPPPVVGLPSLLFWRQIQEGFQISKEAADFLRVDIVSYQASLLVRADQPGLAQDLGVHADRWESLKLLFPKWVLTNDINKYILI